MKGVQDRWDDVFHFAEQVFSTQIYESDSHFTEYADGFSEVCLDFFRPFSYRTNIFANDSIDFWLRQFQLASVIAMKEPILELVQANRNISSRRTYLYSFDYEGEHTRY